MISYIATNRAYAMQVLQEAKAMGYQGYVIELNSKSFEVRFWK